MIRLAAIGSRRASMPKIEIAPRVGLQQAGDHAQDRGLAGAVGAEQGVELAGAHREVEAVDRRPVEALRRGPRISRAKSGAGRFMGIATVAGTGRGEASGDRFRGR